MTLITVYMGELKNERRRLSVFLKSRFQVPIIMKDEVLVVDPNGEAVSPREVKTYVKRFLHHKGLSETFRVTEEHGAVRITKRKHRKSRKTKRRGLTPSPYDTLPYYFPSHP